MVEIRPLSPLDAPALIAIHQQPEVAQWWGNMPEGFPVSDEPDAVRFTILVEGEVAGMAQYGEETPADYRHAWVDIFLGAGHQGRGIGVTVIRELLRHLTEELGHHRVMIDPVVENTRAIRCYEKAGFERIGVTRKAWRDREGRWHDALLMDYVVP